MLNLANRERNLSREKNIIRGTLTIIFIVGVIISIFISKDLLYKREVLINKEVIYPYGVVNLNLMLGIMAYISSLIYYFSNKKDNFFLISLLYLNLFISSLMNLNSNVINDSFIQVLNPTFRLFILTKVISEKKTFSIDNKIKTSIEVSILTIIFSILDIKISKLLISDETLDYLNIIISIIIIMIIIGYIISNILLVKKSLKEVEIVYTCVIASMCLLILRGVYFLYSARYPSIHFIQQNYYALNYLTIISNIVIISGLFIEIIKEINRNKRLENELNIFYYITEFDYTNNILLFDSEWNVAYANKAIINNYCSESEVEAQYKELNKIFCKYADDVEEFNFTDVYKDIADIGFWKGNVILKELDKVMELYIKQIAYNKEIYFFISFNDITKEYKLTEELRKKEELLRTINDNIQDIIIGLSADGSIEYANKAAIRTFKYRYSDLINKNYSELVYSYDKDNIFKEVNRRFNCIGIDSRDNEIELQSICRNISEDNELDVKNIIISKDLTQKNKYDKLNYKYNEIKAYEKSKNEFFANLSHELRTPINIIYSTLQLLDGVENSDVNAFKEYYIKYKKVLKLNCYRMLRLVNNLIDITKFEVGSVEGEFVNLNIVELVEHVTLSVLSYAKIKNINIIFDTDVEELIIKCDAEKIERIMLNLLSNAIKFTEDNKTIFVNITSNDDWVDIKVRDEGRGIPETMKNLIFKRFVQVDKSLNRNTEGSGIGLSIVKSLVEIHNGNILVESEVNKGTTFNIFLPNVKLDNEEVSIIPSFNSDMQKVELELSDIYELY